MYLIYVFNYRLIEIIFSLVSANKIKYMQRELFKTLYVHANNFMFIDNSSTNNVIAEDDYDVVSSAFSPFSCM